MAHAERCPVCYGKGTIEETYENSSAKSWKTCHGCFGRGWVEVSDQIIQVIQPYPYTVTWTWTCPGEYYLTSFWE